MPHHASDPTKSHKTFPRVSGSFVELAPAPFLQLMERVPDALIVHAKLGWFVKVHAYATVYRGFTFFTKSATPLTMPPTAEVLIAQSMWLPPT